MQLKFQAKERTLSYSTLKIWIWRHIWLNIYEKTVLRPYMTCMESSAIKEELSRKDIMWRMRSSVTNNLNVMCINESLIANSSHFIINYSLYSMARIRWRESHLDPYCWWTRSKKSQRGLLPLVLSAQKKLPQVRTDKQTNNIWKAWRFYRFIRFIRMRIYDTFLKNVSHCVWFCPIGSWIKTKLPKIFCVLSGNKT